MKPIGARIFLLHFLRITFIPILLFAFNAYASPDDVDTPIPGLNNQQNMDGTDDEEEEDTKAEKNKNEKNKKDKKDKKTSSPNTQKIFMFYAYSPFTYGDLWVSDGTPEGTTSLFVWPPSSAHGSYGHTLFNGLFYFQGIAVRIGMALWASDGTAPGTVMVDAFYLGGRPNPFHHRFADFAEFNGELYFQVDDGVHGYELWKVTMPNRRTVLVKDINTAFPDASSEPGDFTVFNGELYFSANSGTGDRKLWKTDGTEAGTRQVSDINLAPSSFAPYAVPRRFTVFNGAMYLQADDGTSGRGFELWKTDGTAAGTVLVKDINPASGLGSHPDGFAEYKRELYFHANDGVHGGELWKTDGTAKGTRLVKDIFAGANGSMISSLVSLKKGVYFQAYEPVYGYELWETKGKENGTRLLKDINLENGGPVSDYSFTWLKVYRGELYFQSRDNINGYRLWKTDGSAKGTQLVKAAEPATSAFNNMTELQSGLYYTQGGGLWKTDGTPEGTVLVKVF